MIMLLGFVLLPGFQEAGSQPVLELEHRRAGKLVAESRLEIGRRRFHGTLRSEGVRVEGRVELAADGTVERYERTVRGTDPDYVISRVLMEVRGDGYALREEGPMGSRSRKLTGARVQAVVDPSWPEALLPVLLRRQRGSFLVAILQPPGIEPVTVHPREGRARFLEIPGGGLTLEVDEAGQLSRLLLPGPGGPEVVPAGARKSMLEPPGGVVESPVLLAAAGRELSGTFVRPAEGGAGIPALLLLADAGPRDRDGNAGTSRESLLRELAWTLAAEGFATLRYDKRERADPSAGWFDLLQDASLAVRWLAERPEVARDRIMILGHGEGGLVAAAVAAGGELPLRAVVGLAAPARVLAQALETRLAAELRRDGASAEAVDRAVLSLREDLDRLRELPSDDPAGPGREVLRDLLGIDPISVYRSVGIPLLLIYPGEDEAFTPGDLALLRASLAISSSTYHRIETLEGAGHHFRRTLGRRADAGGADVARPLHPDLVPALRAFLERRLPPAPRGR